MAKTRSEIQAKYDAANRTAFSFKLHNANDADIIEKLKTVGSMNGYIKQLIREDISRAGSAPESAPVSAPVSAPKRKKKMSLNDLYLFLQEHTEAYDGSMYELLNALVEKHMNS